MKTGIIKQAGLGLSVGLLLLPCVMHAAELHAAKTGRDDAQGSREHPFLTINGAARAAQAGGTIWIHAGTYREWVQGVDSSGLNQ